MRSARTLLAAFSACLLPLTMTGTAFAEGSDSEKIDTLMTLQKEVVRTIKNEPLQGKTFGIEFNFLRFILITEQTSVSGGFSLFNIDRNAEISFPFFYATSKTEDISSASWADSLPEIDFMEFTQDVHYRYFLGNTQNGFYLSGFARAAYLSGVKGQYIFDGLGDSTGVENARASEGKLGVGVGLGWRKFSYKGLYWGTSLNVGRYMIGKNDQFRSGFLSLDADNEIIFDVEFFKFGWAF